MRLTLPLLFALCLARPVAAQPAAPQSSASSDAAPHQLDFLLGEWKLEVTPRVNALAAKIHGTPKFPGTWKAWRALEGKGVTDELRLLDPSGNPRTTLLAIRVWDAGASRWRLWAVDGGRATATVGEGTSDGASVTFSSTGTDDDGKVFRTRARFMDITPTAFTYRLDRSYDLGKTWTEGVVTIKATRTAPPGAR
jgi:hypothetical protein